MVLACSKRVVQGFVRGFKAVRRVVRGLSGELSRRFCALKAVRRVVRGFVRGVVLGFKLVWTQNVKTGVCAEPPLSR